jgi:signal peptidase I
MLLVERLRQISTILLAAFGVTIAQPGWSDSSANYPIFTEPFCLKIFEETVDKARTSTWQISDRDRHILTQCRTKFPATVDTSIPLPTGAQCLDVIKVLVSGGIGKLKEIELPEEQTRSIQRCDEVLKYYDLPSTTMLPTLKPHDRIVVDKNSYQIQTPKRGDIIVFNLPQNSPAENGRDPLTKRVIGLPGEKVKIVNGKLYINGKPIREDYIAKTSRSRTESIVVPVSSYLVLGDNRSIAEEREFVPIESIVGKVIWHFGSK